jgi:hypothetical protein
LATLKAVLSMRTLAAIAGEALDGGKKATLKEGKQRVVVIKMLRLPDGTWKSRVRTTWRARQRLQ